MGEWGMLLPSAWKWGHWQHLAVTSRGLDLWEV